MCTVSVRCQIFTHIATVFIHKHNWVKALTMGILEDNYTTGLSNKKAVLPQ